MSNVTTLRAEARRDVATWQARFARTVEEPAAEYGWYEDEPSASRLYGSPWRMAVVRLAEALEWRREVCSPGWGRLAPCREVAS